jgi:4-amino-4-deoxy-L-arabinose transferase-like glycosyltransferase
MNRRGIDWPLLGLVLAAFALRVYYLGSQSLWYDEGFSVYLAGQSLAAITVGELNPPLYHYLLHFWLPLAGSTEFAVRFLSVATGLLTVPLIAWLGTWLFDHPTGLLAAGLVAVGPFHLHYSQEARMYTLAATLALLSSAFLVRSLAGNRRRDWVAYWLSSLAAIYTHYYAFMVLVAQAVFVGVWAITQGRRATRAGSPPAPAVAGLLTVPLRSTPHRYVMCQLALAGAYLPWVPFLIDHYRQQTLSYWPGVLTLQFVVERSLRAFTTGGYLDDPAAVYVALVYLGLVLVGLFSDSQESGNQELGNQGFPDFLIPRFPDSLIQNPKSKNRFLHALYPWLYLLIPLGLAFVLTHDRPKFSPRYLLIAWPAFILLTARGLRVLLDFRFWICDFGFPFRQSKIQWRRSVVGGLIGLLAGLAVVFVLGSAAGAAGNMYSDPRYARDDFRAVARYLEANAGADEMILLLSGHFFPVFTYYYHRDNWYPVPARSAPSPSVENVLTFDVAGELNDVLAGRSGVWLVLWQNEVVDPNGVLTTLLDWAFDDKSVRARFHGIQLKHYRIPPGARLPETFHFTAGPRLDIGGDVALRGYAWLSEQVRAGDTLDLLLDWQALRTTDTIYKLSLRLRDRPGHDWAQADARLAGYWYPTTRWKPGERVYGRQQLQVPPDTPPGTYRLDLIVYRAGDSRFVTQIDLGQVSIQAPKHPPDPAGLAIQHRLSVSWGELRLIGFETSRDSAAPGDLVPLTLLWQAPDRPSADYRLRVELGQTQVFALADDYPTSRWPAGTVLRTRHRLVIPAAVQPGELELRVALLDPDGQPVGLPVNLAFLRIAGQTRQFELPQAVQYPRQVNFSDRAVLLGYDLELEIGNWKLEDRASNLQPPTSNLQLRLTLYWQAIGEMQTSYTVFTHLLDPAGQVRAQHDGLPAGGAWPTTGWLPGQVIVDQHDLTLEPGAGPGQYVLEVGLYDPLTQARVPATDESGQRQPDDRVVLATLEVSPPLPRGEEPGVRD